MGKSYKMNARNEHWRKQKQRKQDKRDKRFQPLPPIKDEDGFEGPFNDLPDYPEKFA